MNKILLKQTCQDYSSKDGQMSSDKRHSDCVVLLDDVCHSTSQLVFYYVQRVINRCAKSATDDINAMKPAATSSRLIITLTLH